jgi:DNA polymerase-4
LKTFGVATIGDLAALEPGLLERRFGKHGVALATRALGIDADPVAEGERAKSIGHEHTFDVDTSDRETIERTILAMAEGVASRLRSSGMKAGTVSVKVRDSAFRTLTRQRTLETPTDLTEPIWRVAVELARPEIRGIRVRLIGVTASNLVLREQLALFGEDPRQRRVAEAADALRRRYGERAVTRARLVGTRLPAPFERDPGTAPERRGVHAADATPADRRARRGAGAAGEAAAPEAAPGVDFDDETDAQAEFDAAPDDRLGDTPAPDSALDDA